jgi:hypothetical protein
MDTSPSSQPGSPAAKISTPPAPSNPSDVDHPPRRRRRCPPRSNVASGANVASGVDGPSSSSGRMSVATSEVVDDADMECSDGEAVDTEDEEDEVIVGAEILCLGNRSFFKAHKFLNVE